MQLSGILINAIRLGAVDEDGLTSVIDPNTNYRGVAYGQPWPLSYILKPHLYHNWGISERELLEEVGDRLILRCNSDGRYTPQVLEDWDMAKKYMESCKAHSLPIRVLLCATSSPVPQIDRSLASRLQDNAQRLGCDYALFNCKTSAVHDDLCSSLTGEPSDLIDKLGELSCRLNSFGLFDKLSDLEDFIALEREIDRNIPPGAEPLDDYWPFELWELNQSP